MRWCNVKLYSPSIQPEMNKLIMEKKRITEQRQTELTFWYFYYTINRLQLLFHPLTFIEFPVCVVRSKNGEFGIVLG